MIGVGLRLLYEYTSTHVRTLLYEYTSTHVRTHVHMCVGRGVAREREREREREQRVSCVQYFTGTPATSPYEY